MKRLAIPLAIPIAIAGLAVLAATAFAAFNNANPFKFDPGKTDLVGADWVKGIGCPTGESTYDGTTNTPYVDPACTTGDAQDKSNEGLVLAKTGPAGNFASAGVTLNGVKNTTITELGYDIRKPLSVADPRGSHCGAGAPRFNIATTDGEFYFLGCNSPAPTSVVVGNGWLRLRWGPVGGVMAYNASTGVLEDIAGKKIDSISIVFDEGQDTGPDNFGLAVLDNIDVSGVLVGRGP
jgi:hypothetical protein